MPDGFDPPSRHVAEVEERMQALAEEVGVWWLFQVLTVVAQVMEMVEPPR